MVSTLERKSENRVKFAAAELFVFCVWAREIYWDFLGVWCSLTSLYLSVSFIA